MVTIEEVVESFYNNQTMDYKDWLAMITANAQNDNNLAVLEFIKFWKPKIGIYCGSFAPWHNGHMNILTKAEQIFDKVILCVGINPDKRVDFPTDGIPQTLHAMRQVLIYRTTLPAFIESLGYDVTLIRGLRNTTDLQYELTQLRYMQDFKTDIRIVNICCDRQFEHISSSAIRNLISAFGTFIHTNNMEESNAFREKIASKYLPFPLNDYSL